jgi:arylsulfatase A-like enzyme
MAERKSVLLVTVDCLRADHCGFMGYPRPTTPFLDALAKQSFVFPTAVVAGTPTYYSFPAILASRYPLAWGREILGLAVEEENLGAAFKKDGYATAFFGAANPYLSPQFGYDFGFDTFCDFLDADLAPGLNSSSDSTERDHWQGNVNQVLSSFSHKVPGLGAAYDELYFQYCQRWAARTPQSLDALRRFPAADVIVDRAQKWLASVGEQPFFLWLHFMDPHAPYYPKEEALTILGVSRLTASRASYLNESWNRFDIGNNRLRHYHEEIIALYDAGICWVDAQLSNLAETLRQFKLWDNCIFAFTADHGEQFLEHDGRYHAPSLAEELIRVPLLLRVPTQAHRALSSNPFSLLHLAPTLLEAAGSPISKEFRGESHWPHIKSGASWGEPAIAECIVGCPNPFHFEPRRGSRLLTVREAKYKLVLNCETHAEHFYDLESDPHEQSPLHEHAAKPHRRRLLEIALAHLRSHAQQRDSETYLRTRMREILQHSTGTATKGVAVAAFHSAASQLG